MQNWQDKVVLITGGSSGIGLACAQAFQQAGAQVAVTGRDRNKLAAAAKTLGPQALLLESDAGKVKAIGAMVAAVRERFGRIDVLCLNAGVAKVGPVDQVDEAQYDALMDINLKGAFFTVQQALPLMASGSAIIFITSIANQLGQPHFSLYAASKAALRSLTQSLALELAPRGIRVNAVSPGPIATPIFDSFGLPTEVIQQVKADMTQRSPSQRFGRPDEVADAVLYLASEASSYVRGAELVVDGGMSLL